MKDYKFYEKFFSTLIEEEKYLRREIDSITTILELEKCLNVKRKYMRYFRNFRKQISLKN